MKHVNAKALTLIAALATMLVGAACFAYEGLTVGQGSLPADFYIAMTLGVVFSLIVGIGLMTLVFYSSRKGYDEPPTFRE